MDGVAPGDYGAVPDAPSIHDKDTFPPVPLTAGEQNALNTCGDGPSLVEAVPMTEAHVSDLVDPAFHPQVRVCSVEESRQIDEAVFGGVNIDTMWDDHDYEVSAQAAINTEHARRKAQPVWSGFVCYFPDAMGKVAELSLIANEQHHPGTPLHWDKSKSKDHMDCLMRHGIDDLKGTKTDVDKVWHKTKVAWRAMAELQEECDRVAAEEA